ncbi:MAG: hypothetical protein IPI55_18300 [Flavobacteriales bacterium]|nr:hypothetical protein [Flavobacteriales bacterium]
MRTSATFSLRCSPRSRLLNHRALTMGTGEPLQLDSVTRWLLATVLTAHAEHW